MEEEFINLTPDNIANEHLCCIIRNRKPHCGIEAKRTWLAERLKEGHVFRKLNAKAAVFIEYASLEKHGYQSAEKIIFISIACGLTARSSEAEATEGNSWSMQ